MTMRTEFQAHRLNPAGEALASSLRDEFSDLLGLIEQVLPHSRERALVVTKLQEASFWAMRSLSLDARNQEPDVR